MIRHVLYLDIGLSRTLIYGIAACLLASPARGAYISEIDLDSPAGDAIEVSDVGLLDAYTLVVMEANPYLPDKFGTVLGVAPLSAGLAVNGVVLVSDTVWPGGEVPAIPLPTLTPTPPTDTLNLSFSRLVVLLQGQADIALLTRPLNDPGGYDASAVADWLVIGSGASASQYQSNGHDIEQINTSLGIDLLSRLVDTSAGSVVGRSGLVGEGVDLETFHVGEPDANQQFDAALAGHRYVYTPGYAYLPLIPPDPVEMPGDTDGDSDIDDADLGTSFSNYTGPVGQAGGKAWAQGDTDADGDVDDADLGTSFSGYTGPASPGTQVPEPAGAAVLLMGACAGLRRRSA